MRPQAVGDLAGNTAHIWVDRGEMNRDPWMLDRTRIEERHHETKLIVLAREVERRAILPAVPDRAERLDIFAHPWPRSRPGHAIAAFDMALHLRAKPQCEAAVREFL